MLRFLGTWFLMLAAMVVFWGLVLYAAVELGETLVKWK